MIQGRARERAVIAGLIEEARTSRGNALVIHGLPGVGKSTLSLNIAVGLQRAGAKVGLMDGDIYGPSMPTMLGIKGQPPQVRGAKILPHYVHGIHAVTIGSLVSLSLEPPQRHPHGVTHSAPDRARHSIPRPSPPRSS